MQPAARCTHKAAIQERQQQRIPSSEHAHILYTLSQKYTEAHAGLLLSLVGAPTPYNVCINTQDGREQTVSHIDESICTGGYESARKIRPAVRPCPVFLSGAHIHMWPYADKYYAHTYIQVLSRNQKRKAASTSSEPWLQGFLFRSRQRANALLVFGLARRLRGWIGLPGCHAPAVDDAEANTCRDWNVCKNAADAFFCRFDSPSFSLALQHTLA